MKETGQQWESMETDILQPINVELTGNHVPISSNHENSDISNKVTSSCESSSCSSNSFHIESSEVKMLENVMNDDVIHSFESIKVDNKTHSNRIKNESAPVINDISNPTKHIKLDTRQLDDNSFDRGTLSNSHSILNNNQNTEK